MSVFKDNSFETKLENLNTRLEKSNSMIQKYKDREASMYNDSSLSADQLVEETENIHRLIDLFEKDKEVIVKSIDHIKERLYGRKDSFSQNGYAKSASCNVTPTINNVNQKNLSTSSIISFSSTNGEDDEVNHFSLKESKANKIINDFEQSAKPFEEIEQQNDNIDKSAKKINYEINEFVVSAVNKSKRNKEEMKKKNDKINSKNEDKQCNDKEEEQKEEKLRKIKEKKEKREKKEKKEKKNKEMEADYRHKKTLSEFNDFDFNEVLLVQHVNNIGKYYKFKNFKDKEIKFYLDHEQSVFTGMLTDMTNYPMWFMRFKAFLQLWDFDDITQLDRNAIIDPIEDTLLKKKIKSSLNSNMLRFYNEFVTAVELFNMIRDEYCESHNRQVKDKIWSEIKVNENTSIVKYRTRVLNMLYMETSSFKPTDETPMTNKIFNKKVYFTLSDSFQANVTNLHKFENIPLALELHPINYLSIILELIEDIQKSKTGAPVAQTN